MSLLKPFTSDEILDAVASGNQKVIDVSGLSAKEIFEKEGADIQAAARAAYLIMNTAEKESDRLRAADLILKIHEAYVPEEVKKTPAGITINIISQQNNQENNLFNLIVPSN